LYCPRCGAEYREGFDSCSDCGVALVTEPPEEAPPVDIDLECVFESTNPALLAVVKTLLEDAGIDYLSSGDAQFAVLPVLPVRIEVDHSRAEEARTLLEDLNSASEPDEQDEQDEEDEEDEEDEDSQS
jgi:predicted  nucleic acid-binding Zn-ribbon protein